MGFLPGARGGVHLQGAAVGQVPVQPQRLILSRFRQIADGEIREAVALVEPAGQQVRDPVHALCVVHVAVPVQVGEGYGPLRLSA